MIWVGPRTWGISLRSKTNVVIPDVLLFVCAIVSSATCFLSSILLHLPPSSTVHLGSKKSTLSVPAPPTFLQQVVRVPRQDQMRHLMAESLCLLPASFWGMNVSLSLMRSSRLFGVCLVPVCWSSVSRLPTAAIYYIYYRAAPPPLNTNTALCDSTPPVVRDILGQYQDLGVKKKAMRGAVRNKESWKGRRAPTQDPSTNT